MWRFEIVHLPETIYCAADAASRYRASCSLVSTERNDELASPKLAEESFIALLQHESSQSLCLQWDEIAQKTICGSSLKTFLIAIESGFDTNLFEIEIIQEYIPFQESNYIHDCVILYHDRTVVPASLRQKVLSALHAAYQGILV